VNRDRHSTGYRVIFSASPSDVVNGLGADGLSLFVRTAGGYSFTVAWSGVVVGVEEVLQLGVNVIETLL